MHYKVVPATLFILGIFENCYCETEHKVHNIVLYPEKHSWCQTTPIQQVVGSQGYESVTIDNNVCVGACYSYSIPKTQPAEPGELIGPYCDSCQPSQIECYHVNLKTDKTNPEGPPILQKRVQIITNCSCQTCGKVRSEDCIKDENTLELPKNLYTDQENYYKSIAEEKPELFEAQNTTRTNKNSETDVEWKNELKHWFEKYKFNETEDQSEDDNDVKNRVLFDRNEENNAKIEQDLKELPENFGIEGAPSHQQGAHIAAGIQHTSNEISTETTERKHHGHHNHHHGHHPHHIGEEQHVGVNVAHLIRGPHSSMVLTPGEAKLHIDSDSLKPNNEGVVIEYESHNNKNHQELLDH